LDHPEVPGKKATDEHKRQLRLYLWAAQSRKTWEAVSAKSLLGISCPRALPSEGSSRPRKAVVTPVASHVIAASVFLDEDATSRARA
jgi:hypothetical protein